MKRIFFLLLAILPFCIYAQNVKVVITLEATEGGAHANMPVSLVDTITKATFKGTTNANGETTISVPPNATYDLFVSNYANRKLIPVPNSPGATMHVGLTYSRNMVEDQKAFAMTDAEKTEVDRFAQALPDTTWFYGSNPFYRSSETYYTKVELELLDYKLRTLGGETVTLIGRKRHKAFKGVTNSYGKILLYLPKGDNYDLSFSFHKNFEYTECPYTQGTSEVDWSFEYIGTKEYLRLKKEEEDRLAAEKIRLAEERKKFLAFCAEHHVTEEEGHKLELEGYATNGTVDVVGKVLVRNNFKNALIVCDVTGSMSPYMGQLRLWFLENSKTNPATQFVFFNDGDRKPDNEKKTGATGGIYYTPAVPVDSLLSFMSYCASMGSGGDCPENNMEALIKGVKMAKKPFSDIVMIADNNAPVKDIILLSSFSQPVHIICCGSDGNRIHPDYLKIAWKTKGSIHTPEKDYTTIGDLKDGESIKIGTTNYRLMKGEFLPGE